MTKKEMIDDLFDFSDKEKEYLLGKKDRDLIKHKDLYKKVYEKVKKYDKEVEKLSLDKKQEFMWYMMSRHRNIYPDLMISLKQKIE